MFKDRKLCSVCNQLGDCFHFGVVTCKACAAFFRRSIRMKLDKTYTCKFDDSCVVKSGNRDKCKRCRFLKCVKVGMLRNLVSKASQVEVPTTLSDKLVPVGKKMFDVDSSSYERIAPTLFSIFEAYRGLFQKRTFFHDCVKDREPKATCFQEFVQVYTKDVYLQNEFLEASFPEYDTMSTAAKKKIFKYFFVSFLILEMGYRSYLEAKPHEVIIANGDFINIRQTDKFYLDPHQKQNCKSQDAVEMYQPVFDQMQRNVFQPLVEKRLDILEFLALAALSLWNYDIEDQPDCFYEICAPLKQRIIHELMSFYEKRGNITDPLYRLSNLLLLLPSLERAIQVFVDYVELKSEMLFCLFYCIISYGNSQNLTRDQVYSILSKYFEENTDGTQNESLFPRFNVDVALAMLKLVQVVEPEEKVTFLFDYIVTWSDRRLMWNPDEYDGINHIYIPRSKMWIPEISIVDATDRDEYTPEQQRIGWVSSNGSAGYYISTITSVICNMNVFRFPLDEHTCSVNLLFYTYYPNEYQISIRMGVLPRPVPELGNGEWQMLKIAIGGELLQEQEINIHSFEATFRRNPGFYIALVMIPAYVINVLSILALFINIDDRSEKFTIGMTNIMSMTFILSILSADLPKTQNLPLLAIYVLTNLSIMLTSLAAVLFLPNFRKFFGLKKRKEVDTNGLSVPRKCGLDSTDGARLISPQSDSTLEKTEQDLERDLMDDILEKTQHSIITVGNTDQNVVSRVEIHTRERKYEALMKNHLEKMPRTVEQPSSSEYDISFEFDATQQPIELPTTYEALLAATRPASDKSAHPHPPTVLRARPTGRQYNTLLLEHPDVKHAGRMNKVAKPLKEKLMNSVKTIHNDVLKCEIVHRGQLVVFMDP
ncbi:unnamed protein product [Caenorhabditis bovis]|uniref:Nuclear receptor domain-containing protein n=1 Tax=Caenorhabditis bovis TaxID=2654633 RepID=A0A8S1EK26_9PELO|nr:unnamed protein product [Caenorhabditis bovis]